ncbi:Putative auto-transporter adhesin, head GIN domain [Arenibacter nanhaiticus]|uniref:Putative auto-transporter adhesin, head GIN domain n=1 Tax=Arenibacter nanhaiticus TaxID=558155 RepID=A0A1M6MWN9_9FLAO|nr:head GIN domain-containing protein [Arenibacter nanhaiticus]SHJ87846.1 Putative auto-transporter adhesin, head GIN domain [Arenibacter nanhaiticus]
MKQIIVGVLALGFGLQTLCSQNEKVIQELQPFSQIKAFDGLSVNLIKSDVNKAVISGANTTKVAIVNNDGVLKLRMEVGKIFSGYRTFVNLYYSGELVVIDVNEDARISCELPIKQKVLELKAQEGGELNINAQVEQLLIKAVTGGIITTSGKSYNQDIQINTGGSYYGKNFNTKFSTVNVNAGSRADVFATEYVKATVKAGGEVLVYGNPAKMDEKTVFGGKITKM